MATVRFEDESAPAVRSLPAVPEIAAVGDFAVLGADVVEIAQVAHSIRTFGDRYLNRVFTPRELAYCLDGVRAPEPHLAARFAAKEAVFKALRAGEVPFDWRWIEVDRKKDGACGVRLHGGMRSLAHRRGVGPLSLSMSHDGAYAIAVVLGAASARSSLLSSTGRASGASPRRSHGR